MQELSKLLDLCTDAMNTGRFMHGFTELTEGLNELRLNVDEHTWSTQVVPGCQAHAITRTLYQDPYTHRALARPRGYAGDAVMMDYLYFRQPPPSCSAVGRAVFAALTNSPNGDSVRWRRQHIAALIRELACNSSSLSIMSVACGHCREHALLNDATLAHIDRYVAADQDLASLQLIEQTAGQSIITLHASAKAIALDSQLRGFDFIYSAGLFDYLADKAALALSKALFGKLKAGGMMLLANFTPDNSGRGYMGAFMNWELMVRTRAAMLDLLPDQGVASTYRYFDPYRNVAYLQVIKI